MQGPAEELPEGAEAATQEFQDAVQAADRARLEMILNKAGEDPAWKQQLLDDPEAALASSGAGGAAADRGGGGPDHRRRERASGRRRGRRPVPLAHEVGVPVDVVGRLGLVPLDLVAAPA